MNYSFHELDLISYRSGLTGIEKDCTTSQKNPTFREISNKLPSEVAAVRFPNELLSNLQDGDLFYFEATCIVETMLITFAPL